MKHEKKETGHPDLSLPDDDFARSICSATDCTGLIPTLPDSDAELDAYEEMYAFCQRCVSPHPSASIAFDK